MTKPCRYLKRPCSRTLFPGNSYDSILRCTNTLQLQSDTAHRWGPAHWQFCSWRAGSRTLHNTQHTLNFLMTCSTGSLFYLTTIICHFPLLSSALMGRRRVDYVNTINEATESGNRCVSDITMTPASYKRNYKLQRFVRNLRNLPLHMKWLNSTSLNLPIN